MSNTEKINARLQALQKAMLVGHCAESQTAVHNSHGHVGKLVAAYFYYIKECIRKDFPSLQYMRTHLSTEAAQYGGFIDATGEVEAGKRMAFLGNSQCSTTLTHYNIHQCWLRNNSQLEVCLTEHSHLHIDCFDESSVVVKAASEDCMCKVRLYGNSHVTISGHVECVQVEHTNLTTYTES